MTCGSCGATIADKAIVCYRCGAPTAIPASRPTPSVSSGFGKAGVASSVVAVALAGLAVFLGDESAGQLPAAVGSGIAALAAGWSWIAGRRPRPKP